MSEPNEFISPEQIADLLAAVHHANVVFAGEVDQIANVGGVNQATVARLSRLTEQLRDGDRARARLAVLDPTRLLAGTAVWLERQGQAEWGATARDRASSRWGAPSRGQSA